MAGFYLPQEESERWKIVQRLKREFNTFVPGWQLLDVSHLRDILAAQVQEARPAAPRPEAKLPREQVIIGLRDFRDFNQARREGRRRLY